MPDYTFAIEDTSPILNFTKDWGAGTSKNDPEADSYSEGSFMVTNVSSANMAFTFFGTAIEILGAFRGNHGQYRVTLDQHSISANGQPRGDSLFKRPLFQKSGLPLAQHTIVLENMEDGKFLDVDLVSWKTTIGGDQAVNLVTVQESDKSIFEFSGGFWGVPRSFPVGTFFGGSGLSTSALGDKVKLNFMGDAISLYGPVGPSGASSYGVRLNNATEQLKLSAQRSFYRYQQLLFHAANLGAGTHHVEVEFLGQPGEELAIDFANIYTTAETASSAQTAVPSGNSRSISPVVVFGLTFSTTVAGLSAIALILIFLRYRFGLFAWLTFVKPYKSKQTQPPKEGLPRHTKDALKSISPVSHGTTLPQSNGAPSVLALTEISEYPFSTSDYYVRTDYSQSVATQSPRPLSELTETTTSSRSSKSKSKRKKYTHPYMLAIAEASHARVDEHYQDDPVSAKAEGRSRTKIGRLTGTTCTTTDSGA